MALAAPPARFPGPPWRLALRQRLVLGEAPVTGSRRLVLGAAPVTGSQRLVLRKAGLPWNLAKMVM